MAQYGSLHSAVLLPSGAVSRPSRLALRRADAAGLVHVSNRGDSTASSLVKAVQNLQKFERFSFSSCRLESFDGLSEILQSGAWQLTLPEPTKQQIAEWPNLVRSFESIRSLLLYPGWPASSEELGSLSLRALGLRGGRFADDGFLRDAHVVELYRVRVTKDGILRLPHVKYAEIRAARLDGRPLTAIEAPELEFLNYTGSRGSESLPEIRGDALRELSVSGMPDLKSFAGVGDSLQRLTIFGSVRVDAGALANLRGSLQGFWWRGVASARARDAQAMLDVSTQDDDHFPPDNLVADAFAQ